MTSPKEIIVNNNVIISKTTNIKSNKTKLTNIFKQEIKIIS